MDKGARLWSCVSGVRGSEKEHSRQGHMRPAWRVRSCHSSGHVRYLRTAEHVYRHLSEAAGSAPPSFSPHEHSPEVGGPRLYPRHA